MRITTDAKNLVQSIALMSMVPQQAADAQVKTFTHKDTGVMETKTDTNGRPLYRADFNVVTLQDGVPVRQEKDVTVALVKPVDVQAGLFYSLAGEVTVTHYVTNAGRLGVSIVAESVQPQQQAQKQQPQQAQQAQN